MANFNTLTEQELQEALQRELKPIKEALKHFKRPKSEDELLTTEETASLLKVSPSTVREYSKRNILKAHRIAGKLIRYKKNEVLEALQLINSPEFK